MDDEIVAVSTGMPVVPLTAGAMIDATALGDAGAVDREFVLKVLAEHGAVLVKGCPIDRPGFVDFTERFAGSFMEYVGGANNDRGSAYGGSSTVLTVTGGNTAKYAIPLHGEMFYTAFRPATLFFCCQRPADANGETTLCDGVALWNALPEAIRRQFEARRLRYRRIYTDDAWQKVYKTDDIDEVERICRETGVEFVRQPDGSLETIYYSPAYADTARGRAFINSLLVWAAREYIAGIDDSKVRWEDGSEIDREMLFTVHRIAEGLTQNVPWEPGMVAIVDNRSVMHGRRAYEDEGRDIIMRLTLESPGLHPE